jgi:hypothetical protein
VLSCGRSRLSARHVAASIPGTRTVLGNRSQLCNGANPESQDYQTYCPGWGMKPGSCSYCLFSYHPCAEPQQLPHESFRQYSETSRNFATAQIQSDQKRSFRTFLKTTSSKEKIRKCKIFGHARFLPTQSFDQFLNTVKLVFMGQPLWLSTRVVRKQTITTRSWVHSPAWALSFVIL